MNIGRTVPYVEPPPAEYTLTMNEAEFAAFKELMFFTVTVPASIEAATRDLKQAEAIGQFMKAANIAVLQRK